MSKLPAEVARLLFREGELVSYASPFVLADGKTTVFPSNTTRGGEFFQLNPIKEAKQNKQAALDNVAAYRNLLLEFDHTSLGRQARKVRSSRLPYATMTYSGGKSYHFIVALSEDVGPERYDYYARMLVHMFGEASPDARVINPNRLTRTPGAIRSSNEALQELIELGHRTTPDNFENWAFDYNLERLVEFKRARALEARLRAERLSRQNPEALRPISPRWQALIDTGTLPIDVPTRHDALVRLGVYLRGGGYASGQIEALLTQAQEAMGLERDDVPGIMEFLERAR